jgi:DNA-binding LacI/PurR family transcriptional regulator
VKSERRSPTMADVAEAAGVSHQTVWRVINGAPNVRPQTRDRILAVIDRLGYRRNQAARSLVLNRSRTIGVLGPAEPDFGPTRSMFSVEHAIRAAGYHPLITAPRPSRRPRPSTSSWSSRSRHLSSSPRIDAS